MVTRRFSLSIGRAPRGSSGLLLALAMHGCGGAPSTPSGAAGAAGADSGGAAGAGGASTSGTGGTTLPPLPDTIPVLDAEASSALSSATRMIRVVTSDWDATPATLRVFERGPSGWQPLLGPYDAVVGANGLSWGRGLTQPPLEPFRLKQEGDKTSPAGLFRLGNVMGYAAEPPPGLSLPYQQSTADIVCVDDPESSYYNSIQTVPAGQPPWSSAEDMLLASGVYEILALVDHNHLASGMGAVPSGGSCIFLHVWSGPNTSTSGCTALPLDPLKEVLLSIGAPNTAVYVQLPQAEYEIARPYWGLPPLE